MKTAAKIICFLLVYFMESQQMQPQIHPIDVLGETSMASALNKY